MSAPESKGMPESHGIGLLAKYAVIPTIDRYRDLAAYLLAAESVVEAARHRNEVQDDIEVACAEIALIDALRSVDELGGITQTTGNQK